MPHRLAVQTQKSTANPSDLGIRLGIQVMDHAQQQLTPFESLVQLGGLQNAAGVELGQGHV